MVGSMDEMMETRTVIRSDLMMILLKDNTTDQQTEQHLEPHLEQYLVMLMGVWWEQWKDHQALV